MSGGGADGKYFPFTTFRQTDCPYETDIYFYNLQVRGRGRAEF